MKPPRSVPEIRADQHHAVTVDERFVVLDGQIGKGVKERLVRSRNGLAAASLPTGDGTVDDTVLGVEGSERVDIATVPGILEARDHVTNLGSGHG